MTMSTYVFDVRPATEHFPGIGQTIQGLVPALVAQLTSNERLVLLCNPSQREQWKKLTTHSEAVELHEIQATPFSLAQQWEIPSQLRHLRANLYHAPYYLLPYFTSVPQVVNIYDLIPLRFPHHVSPLARRLAPLFLKLTVHTAHQVICPSASTYRDLQARFHLPESKLHLTPLAIDSAFHAQPKAVIQHLRERYALPEAYALYVGSNKPHKNLPCLIKAWSALRERTATLPPLVMAGFWDTRYPTTLKLASNLGLQPRVTLLGPVPQADLPALYSAATLFVFPSLYEGFGLPVLEAMACGTPVVCSRIPSLVEIAAEAACYFLPTDHQQIAEAVLRLWEDGEARMQLRARGFQRARGFSWQKSAAKTLEVYRRVTRQPSN